MTDSRLSRRGFLQSLGVVASAGAVASVTPEARASSAGGHALGPEDPMGVLVDLTQCIGCRQCELACKKAHDIDPGPEKAYEDQSVFQRDRRPMPDALTVVNRYDDPAGGIDGHLYAKVNCLHCNNPACVSACIVGALQKKDSGAVVYEQWKCIGCRYCMVACPFQIPTYEYDNVLTPRVRKCDFCVDRTEKGERPACVEACARQVLTYGKRSELIALAHERISQHPDRYVNHIYGEHEAGGTSWMYLTDIPFQQAGFQSVGPDAPPVLTEAIQHGVFKYWLAPVGVYGFLATMMWYTGRKNQIAAESHASAHDSASPGEGRITSDTGALHMVATGGGGTAALQPGRYASLGISSGVVGGLRDIGKLRQDDDRERGASRRSQPHDEGHHHEHEAAQPVERKLMTPGVWVLISLVALGAVAWMGRMVLGLAATTHLDQQHPWGLWIAMDVGSGIALAGGGFVTAALVHIFHREHYHAVARSALLTALLGYTFYVPGLLADIGRWYNIWHPTMPNMWQGNSVLFEVGLCVMIYLNVQYAELAPIICERLKLETRWPRIARGSAVAQKGFEFVLPALLILGVTLSCFHQSSLGNLMVIAPYKLHELWWSPLSPLMFLISAAMVGFPMVIFTMLFASWSLKRKPEMHVLAPLSRYIPALLALYLAVKFGDLAWRGVYQDLLSALGALWIIELLVGVVLPMAMLLRGSVRGSPKLLATACLLVILGVVLNRLNVFVVAYHPPYATKTYFPSMTEIAVSVGLVAALLLVYRTAVIYLPILQPQPKAGRHV